MKNYELMTVVNYLKTLDSEENVKSLEELKLQKQLVRHMYNKKRDVRNAEILELLLA